ncbi:Endonuclease/exonuclease/phosphatase OS=Halanaerobium hydrogeniformans GN=Halsa_2322 PE=4 SV=1: Exo_endo_phos [Gemmataceae bacterium]|nr:Endonuclease/exonuclease/phosphatase OS=Halanaerobium hydrogeniformans GN=Halsa_2322 PE=4 SV=1: Exo_endo_phos [Gemmataceae bacterium]VTT97485.1 Endonuclease/exonuclease/phosphatase OS=Halanaerobium hydrogeniformans GN=Halsa_2322 PE=4 SV=1: Exo_endo_phos [Gemmataceae bacterium]
MLTFLFWNLKTKNAAVLSSLVRHHKVDVLVLAECPLLPGTILRAINKPTVDYFFAPSDCHKLQIFTRFSDQFVLPVRRGSVALKGDDYTFRRLALPGKDELLLCAVHFPSKLRLNPIDQVAFTTRFAHALSDAEEVATHKRTVLVGDLNLNPYDDAVVMTTGLHAVPTRHIARKETRRVKFASNLYFYNPMWAHFGERKQGHAGSYFYATPKARADYWNLYDQVLVRPALLPFFRDDDVMVLWQDGGTGGSLLKAEGRPNEDISDHLPLLFRLHV